MVEKLRKLKEKSGMTNQQIAEKSNLPESTVARIFSGKTPNPTIATAVSMARAMGGSAADFMGEDDAAPDAPPPASEQAQKIAGDCPADGTDTPFTQENGGVSVHGRDRGSAFAPRFTSVENFSREYYEDMRLFYENAMKKKDAWIARMFWCLVGVMLFLLFIVIFDVVNPDFGYVKY